MSVGNADVLAGAEDEAGEVVTPVVDTGEGNRDGDGEREGGGGGDREGEEEGREEEEGAESAVGPSVKVVVEAVGCAVVVGSIIDELELELSCTPAHRQASSRQGEGTKNGWLIGKCH